MPLRVRTAETNLPVYIALALGLLLRIFFILETPFNQPEQVGRLSGFNDEPAHVAFTKHIVETGSLPHSVAPITAKSTGALPTFENYQSPLLYILHAAACKPLNATTANGISVVGRWISLVLMALTLFLAVKITTSLGRSISQATPPLVLIALSLSGVFVRFSTQSGNELAAWLAIGWIILAFIEFDRNPTSRNQSWLIVAFSIGLYIKLTTLVLLPIVLLALNKSRKINPTRAVIGVLYLLLAFSPLALYNVATFGKIIPLSLGFGEPQWRLPDLASVMYAARSAVFPWSEFWQGWVGLALFLPALAFLVAAMSYSIVSIRKLDWPSVLVLTAVAAFVALNLRYDQAEARYLFAAWPAMIVGIDKMPTFAKSPWLILIIFLLPYSLFVF